MTPDKTKRPTTGQLIRVVKTTTTSTKVRRSSTVAGIAGALAVAAVALPTRADAHLTHTPSLAAVVASSASVAASSFSEELVDSLRGHSRKLRARFVAPAKTGSLPVLRTLFGDSAATRAGVYATPVDSAAQPFHFITMRPFTDKVGGRIGSYRIGVFPSERRAARSDAYANPAGFLEVTADNQNTHVSEHFRLRDFLTHDQVRVWPKYLVLREPLLDKLELVIAELKSMGVPVSKVKVMSGFRTPQYNVQGVGAGGRASDSRHQYGDAADVYVVNGKSDWMSDLNQDGKVDTRDAKVMALAAERVEQKNPDLVGGIGIYPATSAHGPFIHIDVRGARARWGH